jgi:hypothetical protein
MTFQWHYGWPEIAGNLVQSFLFTSADHDARAFTDKNVRDGAANAAAGACNDRNLSVQLTHNLLPDEIPCRFKFLNTGG